MDLLGTGRRAVARIRPSAAWRPAGWVVVTAVSAVSQHNGGLRVAGLLVVGGVAAALTRWITPAAARVALLLVCASTGLAAMLLVPQGLGPVPVMVAASIAPRLLPRRPTIVVAALLTVAFGGVVAWISGTPYGALAGLAVPLLAARVADRAALAAERDRAQRLLAELEDRRDDDLHAAALDERARIARDLHDVLAHTLSGLSLQLQAIRAVVARDGTAPGTVVTSLDRAADLARTGLDEARQAVTALREPASAPDGARLRRLVEGRTGACLTVHGRFDDLAPAEREVAVATVREGLTNAGRHAPGAAVAVEVAVGTGGVRLRVQVRDEGAPTGTVHTEEGAGMGLRGLRERAATVGGTLAARPEGRGWVVTLLVPGEATAGASVSAPPRDAHDGTVAPSDPRDRTSVHAEGSAP